MNLPEIRYLVAVAKHRHFARAAASVNISQPTLSGQIRKLEEELGVTLLERNNKRVELTPVGEQIVAHAREILAQARAIEAAAQAARDPLVGPVRLGIIPTLAPYLMPLILQPLKEAYPKLSIQLWEDQTRALIDALRNHRLDAALLATPADSPEITEIELFSEPLLAALPPDHKLSHSWPVPEEALTPELLVLADGHCLANQALAACGAKTGIQSAMQAATLDTLVNLVASGFGVTLIPTLAASSVGRLGVALRPLAHSTNRTIRLASRPGYPRPQALRALEKVVKTAVEKRLSAGISN